MSLFANWKDVTPKLREQFERLFNTPLEPYWDKRAPYLGFDVVKFDDEFIKAPAGQSTADVVQKRYGDEAVALIRHLL